MRQLFDVIPHAFDEAEIAEIYALADKSALQDGTVFSTADNAETLRRSQISWLSSQWLKERLWTHVQRVNDASFGLDVTDQADMQFTCYDASYQGHYDWHHDVHWSSQDEQDRKISVSLQLSAPHSYEGGDFEFEEVKTTADFRAKGTLILFPSYLRHKVSPVTAGTRYSLVAWFFGPRWR